MHAFDAEDLTTVETVPARSPADATNPFGFDDARICEINGVRGGSDGLVQAASDWGALMPWFSRDLVLRVLMKPGSRPALRALEEFGPMLMLPITQGGLGLTADQVVDVAASIGGAPALRALHEIGTELVKDRSMGGLGMSPSQLLFVAPRGGRPVLQALKNVGEKLLQMGFSTDDLESMGGRAGRGAPMETIANMKADLDNGRVTLAQLRFAGTDPESASAALQRLKAEIS